MATIKDLRFLLGLDARGFFNTSKQVNSEYDKTKKRVEGEPLRIRADVGGVLNSFARLGLAINGVQQSYRTLIGPIREVLTLSNQQEAADAKLSAALRTRNLLTKENFDLLKQQASAIQAVTVVGDEQTQVLQALALNFGLAFDEIGEATRGAIGLAESFAESGLTQETALRGIALALQGNFSQLQRYVPALRDASSESEKLAVLQQAMRDGFEQATLRAQTQTGRMQQLSNVFGDFKEQLGDVLKEGLIPIVNVAKPFLEFLTGMDAGTRNATIATVGFIAVTARARTAILAMRGAIVALNASIGPGGWLILGIGAAATALGVYSASTADSTEGNIFLARSNRDVADAFADVERNATAAARALDEEELIRRRIELNKLIEESQKLIQARPIRFIGPDAFVEDKAKIEELQGIISDAEANIAAINKRLEEVQTTRSETARREREVEQNELDQLREFQFETNRISLADYIAYLQGRLAAVREETGAESLEYLRLFDRIADLQRRLREDQALSAGLIDEVQIRESTDRAIGELRRIPPALFEVETEFQEQSFIDLQTQFDARRDMLQENLALTAEFFGEESEEYRRQVAARLALETNFQASRLALAQQGFRATIDLGSQLMEAFRGQSKALFELGKGLSIAQATINAYEAASRAYKDYPWPFNVAVAAIQLALGFAQVKKISGVKFRGFAAGGLITDEDVLKSLFTPRGEDGIIAVQAGEMVINREATAKFFPILQAINEDRLRTGKIRRFQEGGATSPAAGGASAVVMGPEAVDELVSAIQNIEIRIESQLDAIQFFRQNLPKFEKLQNDRRIT